MENVDRLGLEATTRAAYGKTNDEKTPRTALILYGSETGNAQDVAEEAARMAERLHFDTTVLDLDSIALRSLTQTTVVILVVSTTGQGEMPQNSRQFWNALLSRALKPGVLRRVQFASFGLGDSSYARFNVAHRMLRNRLIQLGAQEFCERGEGNEQHPEGHSAGLREWIPLLQGKLIEAFPLPDGLLPIQSHVFIEPQWKLDLEILGKLSEQRPVVENNVAFHPPDKIDQPNPSPSAALMPICGAWPAHIKRNERVTAASHFQDVRLLDLRMSERVPYGPGAVAVIYPKNFPEDVHIFIELMGWQDIADRPLKMIRNRHSSSAVGSSPSPLRHLDLDQTCLTMAWLLENVLDIMSIPRRSFFASLLNFATTHNSDEEYQKERLVELANPELIDELWDYTTRPKRTVLEVMMDFTTIKIPWQYALSVFPIMRGRQFSIASGGKQIFSENGNTRIELLVAIVDPPSPIIKWRRRYGVCTRYIASLEEDQQVNIGVQQGYLNVKPEELNEPVIMIGPGTGIAPMRSLIWQRLAWAREAGSRIAQEHLAGDILFFGCRSEHADYFFHNEWKELAERAGLRCFTTFSRDNDKRKEYVQDSIRANSGLIRDALVRRRGKVYVCGSSGNMPKGVRQAIQDTFVEGEAGMTTEEAAEYLDTMEKQGRYKQETW